MKKGLFVFIISAIFSAESTAQLNRYVVRFKDKNGTPYSLSNPIAYLSQRSIDRRTRYGIATDSTDLPCTPSYVTQVRNVANVTLLNVSKWLNAVTIQTTDPNALTTINGFSFVQSTTAVGGRMMNGQGKINLQDLSDNQQTSRTLGDYYNYGTSSFNEIHLHLGEFLHNIGLRGLPMQIAMLDNGFNNYTNPALNAFDSCNANNQVIGTWDFVAKEANVSNDGSHGMNCFSTIVGNIPGQFIGTAPEARFWLYQTEDNASEYPIEEFNWSCGAERADSSGTDVISSSLGYGYDFDGGIPDYPYSSLNGNTNMSAIAADLAAKKGILVFVAAGNAGADPFHYISSPADADSAIAVGAVTAGGAVGAFSSYGPSSDGQVKPDVASVGVTALHQTSSGAIGTTNGTSLSCPKMAGLGTCLWQGFPEFNNMKIRSALWRSGSQYTNPDDRAGYGIPNMKTAFSILLTDFATSSSSISGCRVTLNWTSKDVQAMKYEIERKGPADANYVLVGSVNPQNGVVLAAHTYQFNNDLASGSSGLYSYRVRQIIDTATAGFTGVYIDTTNITLSSQCIVTGTNPVDPNARKISIMPNPAYNQFTLKVESPHPVNNLNIRIIDMNGQIVARFTRSKSAGAVNYDLPVSKLAKGKYVVSVYDGSQLIASKELIKL